MNKKTLIYLIIALVFLIVPPIVLNAILSLPNPYKIVADDATWLIFWGSYLGAVGTFVVIIINLIQSRQLKKQQFEIFEREERNIRFNNLHETINKLNEFVKLNIFKDEESYNFLYFERNNMFLIHDYILLTLKYDNEISPYKGQEKIREKIDEFENAKEEFYNCLTKVNNKMYILDELIIKIKKQHPSDKYKVIQEINTNYNQHLNEIKIRKEIEVLNIQSEIFDEIKESIKRKQFNDVDEFENKIINTTFNFDVDLINSKTKFQKSSISLINEIQKDNAEKNKNILN